MKITPRSNGPFLRWIWDRDYQSLEDPESAALASRARSLLVWLLCGSMVLIALFVAVSATR